LRLQLTMPPPDQTQRDSGSNGPQRGAILAAALALPGVAGAESAPTDGLIAFKYLWYHDQQPGLSRITVNSPSVYTLLPVGSSWSVEGTVVVDAISGATPRYHTAISGASRMQDDRTAGELKLTRYFRRAAVDFGVAYSSEHDYNSAAGSVGLRLSSEDNNTTLALGTGFTSDRISSSDGTVSGETRRVNDFMAGVTQVLSASDVAKVNVTTAERETLAEADKNIEEYSISPDGDVLVFATREADTVRQSEPRSEDLSKGYRVPFYRKDLPGLVKASVFVTRLSETEKWTKPSPILVESPFTHQTASEVPYSRHLYLSVSPNGKVVLITYVESGEGLPDAWKQSPFIKMELSAGLPGTPLTVLYDLVSGKTTLPLKSPRIWGLHGGPL